MIPLARLGGALLLATLVQAQSSTPTSLAPAAQTVSSSSAAGAPLFATEQVQLTQPVIDNLTTTLNESTAALFAFGNSTANSTLAARSFGSCKVFPGDAFWPSELIWDIFNLLLGGALIKTVPSASPCYNGWGDFNSAECSAIAAQWNNSNFHAADPTSVMWPLYEGRSCLPTDIAVYSNCSLGGYPSYAVNVSNVAQIQLAVNFARNAGLRLVVKNTGHDFFGKSAGAGALSIWTHHLKEIEYLPDYRSPSYTGPAVKMGSGVQAQEIYAAAKQYGVTVVGGEGRTVGVAGGYVLGGGHSPLSSVYGLAADQVLAMEVVLPDGRFTTVTNKTNPDLFWALRGGGGSTFGIVTSIISRVYPQIPVTLSTFSFSTATSPSVDNFWAAVRAYYDHFVDFTNAGTYAYFWILPTGNDSYSFLMNPFFAVNHTVEQYNALLQPWFDTLDSLGVSYAPSTTFYDNFYDAWDAGFPLETVGSVDMMTGSRLFPRANFVNETLLNITFNVHRQTLEAGYPILAFQMKADLPADATPNAANPAFRQMLMHAISSTTFAAGASNAEILADMNYFTFDVLGPWRETCPESGAYMSEADPLEPNWQQAFYGENYARLYSLKQQYDPTGLLYARTAVGSEDWEVQSVDGLPDQNGRLCRVGSK
ncbi:hypothetical protein VTN96DRAFT_3502 [Rasamsonia emersonii]